MGLLAIKGADARLPIGGEWLIEVASYDDAGYLETTTAPVLTVTLPAGTTTTPTMALGADGKLTWQARYVVGTAGRYVARVATATDAEGFTAWVAGTVAGTAMPTTAECIAYLEADGETYAEEDVDDAREAEAANQRNVCRMPAAYPPDLRMALFRRVARNLAMRPLTLGTPRGDAESGTAAFLPAQDPEVRRYERPYRKVVTG